MATNYRNSAGTDFDDIFDPYVEGTKPADTGFRTSDGVDLAGRYAPLSYGSKAPNVNYRTSDGTDVTNLWAAKGTASYAGPRVPGFADNYSLARVGSGTSLTSTVTLTIKSDGTWAVTGNVAGLEGSPASGNWHSNPAAGVGAGCRVRFNGGTWQTLDANRSVSVSATAKNPSVPNDSQTVDYLVEIQNLDGTSSVSDSTQLAAYASLNNAS